MKNFLKYFAKTTIAVLLLVATMSFTYNKSEEDFFIINGTNHNITVRFTDGSYAEKVYTNLEPGKHNLGNIPSEYYIFQMTYDQAVYDGDVPVYFGLQAVSWDEWTTDGLIMQQEIYLESMYENTIYINDSPVKSNYGYYEVPEDPIGYGISYQKNYLLSRTYRTPFTTLPSSFTKEQAVTSIQYLDGLGRPSQQVTLAGSPLGNDLIQLFAYDANGRSTLQYQPYTHTADGGAFRADSFTEQAAFYVSPGVANTVYPFAKTKLESSPLNRIKEQGAPGEDWQPSDNSTAGHTVKKVYGANAFEEVKKWSLNTLENGCISGYYETGKLQKITTKDENWVSGKAGTVEEFTDFNGRVVLKKVYQDETVELNTYYIYDDFGNLRYVLPPAVTGASFDETQTIFENFIYAYRYDDRKRLIEKKIPGKGWEHMVYNELDQIVLTQDANQRIDGNWLFTKYDVFGRPVLTGIVASPKSRATWQSDVNLQITLWESRDNANTNGTATGYTNLTLPNTGLSNYYTINYYDDYAFFGNTYGLPSGTGLVTSDRTKGLLTGSKVNTLGTTTMLLSVNYYDKNGRVQQGKGKNHIGGEDVVDNTYSFTGELMSSSRVHSSLITSSKSATILTEYTYDHMGRKLTTKEKINSQPAVTLSSLAYNEIGQLQTKKLHNIAGTAFLQSIDYEYNERGWLKKTKSNAFTQRLLYNDAAGSLKQYNGNIASQLWGIDGNYLTDASFPNTFSYTYDAVNRLENGASTGVTMSEVLSYDAMGNIASLNRDGAGAKTYTYKNGGNQLESVAGVTRTNYIYDANGNAKTDGRNAIELTYNYLNLPISASRTAIAATSSIPALSAVNLSYTYSASGQKLKKLSGSIATYYAGGIQYTNGNIDFIQTEEGTARWTGSTYTFDYNLTDHLGNVRYTFDQTGARLQADDYYPFGMRKNFALNPTDNKYLYNGKELQEELDGQYDYGARFYDPVISRWNKSDGKAELYFATSPYVYALNQPSNATDPDGNVVIFINGNHFGGSLRPYWQTPGKLTERMVTGYDGQVWNVYDMTPGKDFATAVMGQLGDNKSRFYDGSGGGWHPAFDGSRPSSVALGRVQFGYDIGKKEASSIIDNLRRDKNHNIVESIKIVTHSMGGAYGKGFVRALKEYIQTLPIAQQRQIKITLVADFDPFQAGSLTADPNIKTMQFLHKNAWNISGMGWLANEVENGDVELIQNSGESTDHSIFTFRNDIKTLKEGEYIWDGHKFVQKK